MEINTTTLPQAGDYCAVFVKVWSGLDKEKAFDLTCKLSGTEIQVAINRGCIRDEEEAVKKLNLYAEAEAKKIYQTNSYKKGESFTKFYSPCW